MTKAPAVALQTLSACRRPIFCRFRLIGRDMFRVEETKIFETSNIPRLEKDLAQIYRVRRHPRLWDGRHGAATDQWIKFQALQKDVEPLEMTIRCTIMAKWGSGLHPRFRMVAVRHKIAVYCPIVGSFDWSSIEWMCQRVRKRVVVSKGEGQSDPMGSVHIWQSGDARMIWWS